MRALDIMMKERFYNNKKNKMNDTLREIIAIVGSVLIVFAISYLVFSAMCYSMNGV